MNYQNASACARSFLAAVTLMAIALIASFGLGLAFCNCAYADETPANNTHGTISITSDAATENTIALGIGESATILVSPYQHVQYKGCDKPECPDGCAELVEDCFTVGKGCICMGPAPVLRTATVTAESSDPAIATVSEISAAGPDLSANDEGNVGAAQDGFLTITALAEGTTAVTVNASGLRDWKDASVTYTVVVNPPIVTLGENPVMLHNQFETGTADVALTNASETWAQAITDVSVAPVENGVVGEAVKLSTDQYTVNLGARWGDTLTFNRTAANPIFTVDEFDKDPVTVRTRWGGTMTYPQSKTYQITVEADGYLTASAQIAFYTGGSSTFSVIIDADGNDKTTDDQTVAKSWTADEIKAMATFANGSSNCGMADFRTFSGEGVELTKLLADAGVEVSSSDYFLLDTTDHYGNEFTYDELFGVTRYFTQSIYDDDEVKALAAANSAITDEAEAAAAKTKMRKLLASKALEDNVTVEPRICVNYVESVLRAADLANAVLPTAENTTYDALVAQENQFRFMYGLDLVQDEHVATFETGEGSAVAPQTVKSHLMTSDQNTTMKSSYWANSLVIYRGAGEQAQPSTAADAIQKPADPTREGYTFGGWFTDEACTQAFDFAANDGALDEDITLYAKWDEASNGGDSGGNNGGNGGSVTPAPAPASAPVVAAAPSTITVNAKNVTAATIAAAAKKAGATKASLTKVILGSKVAKIGKSAFKDYSKVKTIVLKTKKLKKKAVKDSLKGSKVKTIQVKIGAKKVNKKFAKKYKKIFTKSVAGKKAKVK